MGLTRDFVGRTTHCERIIVWVPTDWTDEQAAAEADKRDSSR